MAKHHYEVTVGNICTVYNGTNKGQALKFFGIYRAQSKMSGLRASGEDVTLLCDDEIIKEYLGSLSQNQ